MIRDVHRKYFEIWGTEEAQNSFLKGLLAIFVTLYVLQSIALCFLYFRKPILVAVGKSDTRVLTLAPPSDELLKSELERVVRHYAEAHYTWDSTTIEKSHAEAAKYVADAFVKSFQTANADQIKVAKEKKLAQKVYVSDLAIDPQALTARITLDRILIVENLRAASSLVLDLQFEYGARTNTNPEGIYIKSEKLVTSN